MIPPKKARKKMQAVLVSRTGTLSAVELPVPEDYFKTCGFRNPEGFGLRATWTIDTLTVQLYAKIKGKANSENTYEFPPPVESALYFGRCLLVNPAGPLKADEWETMRETLMGGFEDLHTETESDEEPVAELTKEGYEKDGFVVSDDSELEEEPYV